MAVPLHGPICQRQEWVDFDFEMRLYFLPPPEYPAESPIEPKMIQCNAWGPSDDTKSVPGFGGAAVAVSGASQANHGRLTARVEIEEGHMAMGQY